MNQSLRLLLTSTALALLGIIPATAQQITGTPGSPSATTTIDGNYIPNHGVPFDRSLLALAGGDHHRT
jgi:hypothetical protein